MNKWLDFTALTFYCGLIYWLSDQETLPVPILFSFQDKIHHAGAYFAMSLLAWRFFRHFSQHRFIPLLAAIGFCSFYGATDEWHQSFVLGRSSDVWDWLADTVGASLAMLGFYVAKLKLAKQLINNENKL
jgi:VanZ family protein